MEMTLSHLIDATFWLYLLLCGIGLYGSVLLACWAIEMRRKHERIPSVNCPAGMMFFGIFIINIFNIYACILRHVAPAEFMMFTKSVWWPLRLVPALIGSLLFVVQLSKIAFSFEDKNDKTASNQLL